MIDVVHPVQELGLELGPQGLHHPPLHLLGLVRAEIDDVLAPDVGGHDQTVLRKSTVRPWPSVRRPSSKIWSRVLKTSGCAFSISSKSTTL